MALGLNAVKASVFRRSRQQALTGPEQTTRYAGGADFVRPAFSFWLFTDEIVKEYHGAFAQSAYTGNGF